MSVRERESATARESVRVPFSEELSEQGVSS